MHFIAFVLSYPVMCSMNLFCNYFVGSENPPMTAGVISSRDINLPAVKNRTTQPPQPAPRSTAELQAKRVQDQSAMPVVRKKDREYLGMFEYRKEDEQIIVSRLINGVFVLCEKTISIYFLLYAPCTFLIILFLLCWPFAFRFKTSNCCHIIAWFAILHFDDVHSTH